MSQSERRNRADGRVFAFLASRNEPVSSIQIADGISGRNCEIYSALSRLTGMKILCRHGDGRKGSPFRYAVAASFEEKFKLDDKKIEKQINGQELTGESLN